MDNETQVQLKAYETYRLGVGVVLTDGATQQRGEEQRREGGKRRVDRFGVGVVLTDGATQQRGEEQRREGGKRRVDRLGVGVVLTDGATQQRREEQRREGGKRRVDRLGVGVVLTDGATQHHLTKGLHAPQRRVELLAAHIIIVEVNALGTVFLDGFVEVQVRVLVVNRTIQPLS
jgi:hypothetical protein